MDHIFKLKSNINSTCNNFDLKCLETKQSTNSLTQKYNDQIGYIKQWTSTAYVMWYDFDKKYQKEDKISKECDIYWKL